MKLLLIMVPRTLRYELNMQQCIFFLLSSIVLLNMQNSDLKNMQKIKYMYINNTRNHAAHGKVRKYKWKLNSSYCRRD